MATIRTGPTISKIAGSAGNKVYSSWKGRGVIRSKSANRSNPSSPRQAAARAGTTALSKAWSKDLTDTQKALWEEAAQKGSPSDDPASSREQGSRVVIPQPRPVLSGYDAFIRANQRAIMTGITPIGVPIVTPGLAFPLPVTSLERVVTPPIPVVFALSFDGVNEDVSCGDVLDYDYDEPFAFEFWLKAPSLSAGDRLVNKMTRVTPTGYQIAYIGGKLRWDLREQAAAKRITTERVFVPGAGYRHIICTYDGSNDVAGMEIYVDGVPGNVGLNNFTFINPITNASPLGFASWDTEPGTWLQGQLDCIRNFNRNLLQADVNILFAGGFGLYGGDPLGDGSCQGSWPVCTGAGNTLFDISGNNFHGTLRNMEPGDWVLGKVPCPDIPGVDQIQWTPPTVEAGSKIRIWILSYDAGVHKQHVATIDAGVGFWIPDTCRVAQGAEVPIASMPGHYLIQADVISPSGNQSPPSNTLETIFP